jgi:outer membrane cobalamin receptor
LYVRGGSSDQNLTLIDGVPVYNPSHLGGFSSTFNGDAIQNMKLIKGTFPAEYGNRLSSVLDVTMRRGSEDKFTGTAGLNLISSRLTLEGPFENKSTYIFSGRKMFLDKIVPSLPSAEQIPKYGFYDFNGKINYNLNENERIFISGFASNDYLQEPQGTNDVGFEIDWSNATLNLTWSKISSETAFTNTSIMYTNYSFSTLLKDKVVIKEPLDFFTSSIIHDVSFRRETQTFFADVHTFKIGAEAVYHNFNTTTSDFFVKELKYRPNYGKKMQTFDLGIFFQDDWQVSDALRVNGGIRLLYQSNAKFFGYEPRVTMTFYMFDRFIFRAGFAVANQTLHLLSRNDVYLPTDVWYPASETIQPSRGLQTSIGFEATSFERTFLFSLDAYYKDMKHLYDYSDNADFGLKSDFEKQLTEGTGDAYGVEMFLNKRIGEFSGWVGYTLAWTKRHFPFLNKGNSFYPRFDRRHDISIVLTYEPIESLNFGATWTYGTGQAYSLPTGQYAYQSIGNPQPAEQKVYIEYSNRDAFRLPAFHKLDISARYSFTWGKSPVELSLNIYNTYNRYNVFSKYIGYQKDELTGEQMRVLKQFTLFPFLPTLGVKVTF